MWRQQRNHNQTRILWATEDRRALRQQYAAVLLSALVLRSARLSSQARRTDPDSSLSEAHLEMMGGLDQVFTNTVQHLHLLSPPLECSGCRATKTQAFTLLACTFSVAKFSMFSMLGGRRRCKLHREKAQARRSKPALHQHQENRRMRTLPLVSLQADDDDDEPGRAELS